MNNKTTVYLTPASCGYLDCSASVSGEINRVIALWRETISSEVKAMLENGWSKSDLLSACNCLSQYEADHGTTVDQSLLWAAIAEINVTLGMRIKDISRLQRLAIIELVRENRLEALRAEYGGLSTV